MARCVQSGTEFGPLVGIDITVGDVLKLRVVGAAKADGASAGAAAAAAAATPAAS